jgi:predicted RNA-binding Zn-ribbon protein involved in translation (DUF1610 family)
MNFSRQEIMSALNKYKSFGCPKCGTDNLATDKQSTTGIVCVSCGMGYIPVQILQRGSEQKKSTAVPILIGIFFMVAIGGGFVSIWLAIALGIITLLIAIVYLLSTRKTC